MIDGSFGIESQHFVQTGIDDRGDAFDRQGSLRDVRREDDPVPRGRRQRTLLSVDVQ